MESVAFTYNGSTTVVATITGATPGQLYNLVSDDNASTHATGTAVSATLVLTVSSVGGLTPGDTFDVFATRGTALAIGVPYIGGTVFTYSSGGAQASFTAAWHYDGNATVTATFVTDPAVTYGLQILDTAIGGSTTVSLAGDGATHTMTVVNDGGGGIPVAASGDRFYVNLFTRSPFWPVFANRLFTAGTAGAGFAGNPGGVAAIGASSQVGRVLIAFDDGPLEPSPTWTRIDDTPNLVSGYDVNSGKQTERDSTDTGNATVYLNDTAGLFDPNNAGSPYFGKLDGKQILLQLWDPVAAAWFQEFRGLIDDYGFDINPATNPDGTLIVANIQIDCVDIFDYLEGYEVAPGLDGTTPPAGSEGIVFYKDTLDANALDGLGAHVDRRIKEALTDASVDSTRFVVFTGNVAVQDGKYDPGDSILTVIRDAADAELPMIANIYTDKQGRFIFHGRESRFDPLTVEATTTPDIWDFNTWKVGDGAAITADATRAQIRVFAYARPRSELINAALCTPNNINRTLVPGQVYVDATSITDYGKHSWSAENLLIREGLTTGNTANVECAKYAELTVKNHKDPRNTIKTLTLKSIQPSDARAAATWQTLARAEISDIMNVRVGYPSGVGIDNIASIGDGEDYYIEGFELRVRPATAIESGGVDNVECDYNVSPAVWSMDTHGVFA